MIGALKGLSMLKCFAEVWQAIARGLNGFGKPIEV